MKKLRKIVGGKRKRHKDVLDGVKYDLNLSYITDNIIGMSYPGSGFEKAYRDPIDKVQDFLDKKHKDKYWIFNVSERTEYNPKEFFHERVSNYLWPDHHAPTPFTFMLNIVKEAKEWLELDPENIVIVHCNSGKGRTGTVICAIMLYTSVFDNVEDCLRLYVVKRGVAVG